MERMELGAWLHMLGCPGLGRSTARRLLAAYGSPVALHSRSRRDLEAYLAPAVLEAFCARSDRAEAACDQHWQWWQQDPESRSIVAIGDPRYPASLLNIEDPPLLLFLTGRLDVPFEPDRAVAIVGSRNPTPQGELNARQFSLALAGAGLTIVSGLARGIDGCAHEAALQAPGSGGLRTVAVVGTGLDRVYPRCHHALAQAITGAGLLISEYPLGTGPMAHHFPQRNRLIAGLSCATLVVEAALDSGSLITAREAATQGKGVFAIPGSIHAPQARGCHALLREGAALVETADDVLRELPATAQAAIRHGVTPAPAAAPAPPTSGDPLLEALGWDPLHLDALQARTGLPMATLQARLLGLELDGHVTRLPGARIQRLMRA